MNQRELLDVAYQARPDLMEKTAQAIALSQRLAPEFSGELMEEVKAATEFTAEKVAGVVQSISNFAKDFAQNKGKELGGKALTAVGVGLGSALATDLYDIARRGLTKNLNWKRIMEANPNIKNEVRDPARLKPAFNTLHRYAPDFTADPMFGGSILIQLANQPSGHEHQLISQLLGSRKNLQDIKNNQFKLFIPKDGKGKDKAPREPKSEH